jgi:hypothetical protein
MHTIGTALVLFRPALLLLAAAAQIYLFVRLRRSLRGLEHAARFPSLAWWLGAAMGGLWALHAYVVFAHLPWVEPPVFVRIALLAVVLWNYGSILSALVLLALRGAGRLTAPNGVAVPDQIDAGRRRLLQVGTGGLAAVPFGFVGYGAGYATGAYELTRFSLPFGRPLRVVHLSDIHAGMFMTRDHMRVYTDLVNSLKPDLFVLTGDFISDSMYFFYGCAEEMPRVRSRYGTYAVLGNHEHWYGKPREIEAVLTTQRGMRPISTAAPLIYLSVSSATSGDALKRIGVQAVPMPVAT